MKGRKTSVRLVERRMAWEKQFGDKTGFKRPGSNKKNFPHTRPKRGTLLHGVIERKQARRKARIEMVGKKKTSRYDK